MNRYGYTISPDETDRSGLVTLPSMYRILIDSISQNIRKEGYGVDVLEKRGLTWALARCAVESVARPALYDEIQVEVWSGGSSGFCHNRCVRAVDRADREICRGVTQWCVLDRSSRRPQPPFQQDGHTADMPCAAPLHLRPFKSLVRRTVEAGYSECDFNGHLNNAKYLEMFCDMIPRVMMETLSRFRLDVNFRKEIPCGSLAESYIVDNVSSGYDYCMYYEGAAACCASISRL